MRKKTKFLMALSFLSLTVCLYFKACDNVGYRHPDSESEAREDKARKLTIKNAEWLSYESNLITILDEFYIKDITRHLPDLIQIDEPIPESMDNLGAKITIRVTDSNGQNDEVILYIDKNYQLVQCGAPATVVNQLNIWFKNIKIIHDQIRKGN